MHRMIATEAGGGSRTEPTLTVHRDSRSQGLAPLASAEYSKPDQGPRAKAAATVHRSLHEAQRNSPRYDIASPNANFPRASPMYKDVPKMSTFKHIDKLINIPVRRATKQVQGTSLQGSPCDQEDPNLILRSLPCHIVLV